MAITLHNLIGAETTGLSREEILKTKESERRWKETHPTLPGKILKKRRKQTKTARASRRANR